MGVRVREITDAMGVRLRISVTAEHEGALITLDFVDQPGGARAMLDSHGAEVLWGFILSARIAVAQSLPDEMIASRLPTRLQLVQEPRAAVVLTQAALERPFEIGATFWDRLCGELCLAGAHARRIDQQRLTEDSVILP